jgi:hypothetical protein
MVCGWRVHGKSSCTYVRVDAALIRVLVGGHAYMLERKRLVRSLSLEQWLCDARKTVHVSLSGRAVLQKTRR